MRQRKIKGKQKERRVRRSSGHVLTQQEQTMVERYSVRAL